MVEFIFIGIVLSVYFARPALLSIVKWKSKKSPAPVAASGTIRYLALLSALSLVGLLVLAFGFGYTLLPLFGILASLFLGINLYLVIQKRTRILTTEILAVAGLSLSAPCGYYVAVGNIDETAYLVYLLDVLFLTHLVVYVRARISIPPSRTTPIGLLERIGRHREYYTVLGLVIAILFLLTWTTDLRVGELIAFLPSIAHSLVRLLQAKTIEDPFRLGFVQLGHCLIFSILLVVLMRDTTPS